MIGAPQSLSQFQSGFTTIQPEVKQFIAMHDSCLILTIALLRVEWHGYATNNTAAGSDFYMRFSL